MNQENEGRMEQKLDEIIRLLQHNLALELYDEGVSQAQIGKHLHVATATVSKLLKGVEKEK